MESLNTFSDHAPKTEWFTAFFKQGNAFLGNHGLGPVQIVKFTRFLKDAELISKRQTTPFFDLAQSLGWDSDGVLGLMLVNLVANNPQMAWYVRNLNVGQLYARQYVEDRLVADGVKPRNARSVYKAFTRIVATPFGTVLGFGAVGADGSLSRTACRVSDARVVLYGLFKFAEQCGGHTRFTLNELLDDNIERPGVSPTRIFGLTREDMEPLLKGLTSRYPLLIPTASFTHGLGSIVLADDASSADVLNLFRED